MAANLIQLRSGSKSFGVKSLFENASFAVNEGEHVGVIGPNGTGKTTLLKVCSGEESLDFGELVRSNRLRLGYLVQEMTWPPETTLEQYIQSCTKPTWELKALADGLGLSEDVFRAPLASLSGGYRMRCRLLHLIGCEPNLMLLDEPTNYLDLETVLVLEKFLQSFRGAFLLVSHDREFLRRTTDHILEIESAEITKYPGNIDDYFEEKAIVREQLEKQALSIEAKRKAILKFATRFGAKATKAKQAQSKLKSLERLERIEIRPLPVSATIRIPHPTSIGRSAIEVRSLDLGYGGRRVLRDVNIEILSGDHLAVVGMNGAGKSTFLKGLAKILSPMSGAVTYGHRVSVGYYAQHVSEALVGSHTVLEALEEAAHPSVTPQDVRDLAGSLLFSGEAADKRIAVLSGGEKARVALGRILLTKAPVLLLDEPINHLDFDTVEALTQALRRYPGTVIFVSHDRGFVRRVATKILEVRDARIRLYPGTYDEYVWSLEKGALSQLRQEASEPALMPPASGPSTGGDGKVNFKDTRKTLERRLRRQQKESAALEQQITEAQRHIERLNARAAESHWQEATELLKEVAHLQDTLHALETRWLKAAEERDDVEGELRALVPR